MSLIKAKQYIRELHRRQMNPYLWPDFLTGLPDKAAVLHRLNTIYPRLGKSALAYIRIANVNPFLLKYGTGHHAPVVQWAAAILKTVAQEHGRGTFVGTVNTHDFAVMAPSDRIGPILLKSASLFRRHVHALYSAEDRKRGRILSFQRGKEQISIGLMDLIHVLCSSGCDTPQSHLLPALQECCTQIEQEGRTSVLFPMDRSTPKQIRHKSTRSTKA